MKKGAPILPLERHMHNVVLAYTDRKQRMIGREVVKAFLLRERGIDPATVVVFRTTWASSCVPVYDTWLKVLKAAKGKTLVFITDALVPVDGMAAKIRDARKCRVARIYVFTALLNFPERHLRSILANATHVYSTHPIILGPGFAKRISKTSLLISRSL